MMITHPKSNFGFRLPLMFAAAATRHIQVSTEEFEEAD